MIHMGFNGHVRSAAAAALLVLGAAGATAQTNPPADAAQATDVTGTWIDHTGQGAVTIEKCGERMCGKVVWLKNPNKKSKTGKGICGAQILGDLKQRPNNLWAAGWIYNPEDEERFDAEIRLRNPNTLSVMGYMGVKWLSETYTWKRATAALEPCAPKQAG